MAGESNQVKWRGVRKVDPAIADLDAIEDVIGEQKYTTNASAGTNTLSHTAVPSGKIQIITNILAVATVGTPSRVEVVAVIDAVSVMLRYKLTPGQGEETLWTGEVFLDATDYIKVIFYGMTAGDDIFSWVVGYQIDKY